MSDRNVTLGLQFVADTTQARRDWEQFVKDVQGRAVNIPVSAGSAGTVGAPTPVSTIGGLSTTSTVGITPATGAFGPQFTRDLASAVAQAVRDGTRTAARGGSGPRGGAEDTVGPLGLSPEGADLRSRAFARAAQFDRVDTAVRRARLGQNLARTAGTYGDPAAGLNEAISEGALMEERYYPTAAMSVAVRRGVAGRSGGVRDPSDIFNQPMPSGARGRLNDLSVLISGMVGAGRSVLQGAGQFAGLGVGRQIQGVYANAGDTTNLLAAQQQEYQQIISNLGVVGGIVDYYTGGSAQIIQDRLDIARGQARSESTSNIALGRLGAKREAELARYGVRAARERNPFNLREIEAESQLGTKLTAYEAEVARRRERVGNLSVTDPFLAGLERREMEAFRRSQGPVIDEAYNQFSAQLDRVREDRNYDAQSRSAGFAGRYAANLAGAQNNRFGEAIYSTIAATQQAMTEARASGHPEDASRALAVGISEALKTVGTTVRENAIASLGLQGSAAAANLRASHRPLDAEMREIETQRRLKLAQVPNGLLFDLLGGQNVRDSINDEAEAQRRLARTRFGDAGRLIDIGQTGRENRIDALLRRSPLGAEAAEIAASALGESASLQNEGRGAQALRALRLGVKGLDLTRRQALESFEPTTLPSQNFETRPLGQKQADFGQQLDDLDQSLKDILAAIQALGDSN